MGFRLYEAEENVRVSQLPQFVQVEKIDADASAASVQTTTEIRVQVLLCEKLSKDAYRSSFARASSGSFADILRSKAERRFPTLIKYAFVSTNYDCYV